MAGKNNSKIDTAVIAAAGFGARLSPLTLHQPKAMVAVADRPLIHCVIDQIAAGGIKRFIVVMNPKFQAIKRYIHYQFREGKWRGCEFRIIEKNSKGFADSVLAAEKFIGRKHFIAASCDDLLDDQLSPFLSLIKISNRFRRPVAVLRQIKRTETANWGVVSVTGVAKDIWRVHDVTEKPSPSKAASDFGSIADYVLPAEIFRHIRLMKKLLPAEKEPTIVDALKFYLAEGGELLGWVFRGHHFDGGSKIGLLKASAHFASKHPEFGPAFKKYLRSL